MIIPYEEYVVYGPYSRSDGRLHVVLVHKETKTKRTVSYPRYRIEIILGRYLNADEEVHHKDENVLNNDDSNFEVIIGSDHRKYHKLGVSKYLPEFWTCQNCGKQWLATVRQMIDRKSNIKKKGLKNGPFCSKSCAASFSK